MSTPGVGHPDGQAYALWRASSLFVSGNTNLTSGAPITLATYLTNYASVYMRVQSASTVAFTVTVLFRDSPTGAVINSYNWVLPFNGSSIVRILPALGNYLSITLSTAQVGTAVVSYAVAPVNIAAHGPVNPTVMPSVFGINALVNASSTLTANIVQSNEGFAMLSYAPKDASGSLSLVVQTIAESGLQVAILYEATLPTVANQGTVVQLFTPANPVQLIVTNNDVANPHHLDYVWVPNARL